MKKALKLHKKVIKVPRWKSKSRHFSYPFADEGQVGEKKKTVLGGSDSSKRPQILTQQAKK